MAAAFAQFFIFAMVLFVALCAVSTGVFYLSVLTISNNMPLRLILEVVIGLVITKLLTSYGNLVIFRGGDLAHPVLWTWYSTYLLIINLIKGIFSGFIRMATMFVWVVVFIGKIDRSNFPDGFENTDPAFSAFLQTLNFHHRSLPHSFSKDPDLCACLRLPFCNQSSSTEHRVVQVSSKYDMMWALQFLAVCNVRETGVALRCSYRNPVFTAFGHKHAKAKEAEEASASAQGGQASSNMASDSRP